MSAPVEYILPANKEIGIGSVILKPESAQLIPGVQVFPYALWPDDRGYFLEVARIGQGGVSPSLPRARRSPPLSAFPAPSRPSTFTASRPITGLPPPGMFQVALVDLRADSHAFGRRNTLYVGALLPGKNLIPPGVGHGYKVISHEPAMLVYVTNRTYNPADEGRIVYNDPSIHYDWINETARHRGVGIHRVGVRPARFARRRRHHPGNIDYLATKKAHVILMRTVGIVPDARQFMKHSGSGRKRPSS